MDNNINNKYVLVIGGSGILGKAITKIFKSGNPLWKIHVIDFNENEDADKNIILSKKEKLYCENQMKIIYSSIDKFKYDSILNVAGLWEGGSINNLDIFEQSEKMFNANYFSSLLAGHLATKFLQPNSVLLFTGAAKIFKESSPEMLAYHVAKTATHCLALTLKDSPELPNNTIIITILPEIIDTPDNRKVMPTEDFTKWTKPEGIATLLKMWVEGCNRPKSGSFTVLKNKENIVIPELV